MASEEVETVVIVLLLLIIVLFWIGLCHLLLTSYCQHKSNDDEDVETSFEYITKDISEDMYLPQKLESLSHIYENKLTDYQLL